MLRHPFSAIKQSVLGCIIVFVALLVGDNPAYALPKPSKLIKRQAVLNAAESGSQKQHSKPKRRSIPTNLTIYGVEIRRPQDNVYDSACAKNLKRKGLKPILYGKKEILVSTIKQRITDQMKRVKKSGAPNSDVCIQELNLYGHGKPGFFGFGAGQSEDPQRSTFIAHDAYGYPNDWKKAFQPLVGHFCADAEVKLFGCWVGSEQHGADLLFDLASFLNVTVSAPVEQYFAGYIHGNKKFAYTGEWQKATPKQKPTLIKSKHPPTENANNHR